MRRHTAVYMEGMGYRIGDFMPCEWCGAEANDVHHLIPRGMGGSKTKDYLANLMALCRKCHLDAEARKISRNDLEARHLDILDSTGMIGYVEEPIVLPKNLNKVKIQNYTKLYGTKTFKP